MHDSVLTTLLSAAAAATPEQQALAARMARDARAAARRGRRRPAPSALDRVGLPVLVRRLRAALTTFSTPFIVRVVNAGGVELPVEVVEALYSAAVQAMVNSLQHADEPGRRRSARAPGPRASRRRRRASSRSPTTASASTGDAVPAERLGLRVSIVERMANAGGSADIDSQPGRGTTVTVAWPVGRREQASGGGA